jgi:seryl-tRNA synthetase
VPRSRGDMTAKDLGMHDIKWIHEHPDAFDRGLARRGLKGEAQYLISLDDRRRAQIRVSESFKARRNKASKEIAEAKAKNDKATVEKLMAEVAECKTSISTLEAEEKGVSEELNEALKWIPNLPLDEVPDGTDASDNVEHHRFGAKRNYGFTPQQHFDLGEALGQMDFETAAKLSGARFVVLKSGLARLERALGQFMLDLHANEHGYTEIQPPLLVREDVMFGTGQLPKFRDDQFETKILREKIRPEPIVRPIEEFFLKTTELQSFRERFLKDRSFEDRYASELLAFLNKSALLNEAHEQSRAQFEMKKAMEMLRNALAHSQDTLEIQFREYLRSLLSQENFETLWLIPTAEVPLTNLVRESIVDEAALPMRFTAGTPCFRAEAGAAGKDTRGMIRQHQFDKVELVSITTPEESRDEHERMLACAEEVLRRLDLHYRVVTLCTGDMGFAAQKTYDIEVWLPGQNMYREISSCSLCGEFQARRMNARYRAKDGRQIRYVHTLNGSGVAVGRALIAVMETYQQQGGSIAVPDVLQSYMGGLKTIERAQ